MNHPLLNQRERLWLYLVVWALFAGVLTILVGAPSGGWPVALALTLPLGLLFAILCLGSWYPCRTLPLATTSNRTLVASHGGAAVISALLWVVAGSLWARLLGRASSFAEARALYADKRMLFFVVGMLAYLLAVAVHYLLLAVEESRIAEAQALELEVLAREAELKALKAQLDPHFLFNSLNSVSSLCGSDPEAARAMTVDLASFLRASLGVAQNKSIPLVRELELIASYLAIERVRYGDRLLPVEEVDRSCLDIAVPPLLLQPLVENAVRHGIAHLVAGGEIWVKVSRLVEEGQADRVRLTVDNECDPHRPRTAGGGIGLANVRRRLRLLYGGDARLTLRDMGRRFRVTIELPA